MKDEYTDSKSDLFAAFIERCADLAGPRGVAALITMQSWMFLSSYEKLRASLLTKRRISSMLHLGARAFDSIGGEVVSSTAFVLANVPPETRGSARERAGTFIRLVDGTSETEKAAALRTALEAQTKDAGFHLASDADFTTLPGSPIVYWLSEKMRTAFGLGMPLGAVASAKAGISTGNNGLFQRSWFEVSRAGTAPVGDPCLSRPYKWYPCRSGGDFRRWYGNAEVLIDWRNEGESIRAWKGSAIRNLESQGLPALTYSKISSGDFALRSSEAGFLFDDTGRSLPSSSGNLQVEMLSLLNSSIGKELLSALAPTLTFTSGEIEKMPMRDKVEGGTPERIEALVEGSKRDWNSFETSWDFERNALVAIAQEARAVSSGVSPSGVL